MLELFEKRRSIRKYRDKAISKEDLVTICKAGLSGPSGRGLYPIQLFVIEDRNTLSKLSKSRIHGSSMIENAKACILVFGKMDVDTWIEDCSICMANMHLQASSMGIGSCWVQGRNRYQSESMTTEEYIKEFISIPDGYVLEAMLALGYPDEYTHSKEIDMTKIIFEDGYEI
ncbi:MAG: nitroreductase family protein [Holdemanella sp.]|nr:nitroreductase family protein [Holdemanella sp.]